MNRIALLLILLILLPICVIFAAPAPKEPVRKLGPEWVKEKDGQDYHRKLELTTVAHGGASGNLYTHLPLVDYKRDLYITEDLNFKGRSLALRLSGEADNHTRDQDDIWKYGHPNNLAMSIERTENKDGKAVKHTVELGQMNYTDLDGDGVFDLMVDARVNNSSLWYIFLADEENNELQLVRVGDMSRNLNLHPVRSCSVNPRTPYTFDKGKWRVQTFEDRRLNEGLGKGKKEDKDN
jgi:hypothetical protein